jgi:cytochrome bd-type quinol oxidase subunit 2
VGCAAYIIALGGRDRISGGLHEHMWGLVFPFIGFLAIYFIFLSVRLRPKALPFTMTVLFIVAAILTLAVMFWPYMIPYEITVANAAAPESSLSFLFWGAGPFVLPAIAINTATVYRLFGGQITQRICGHTLNQCGKRRISPRNRLGRDRFSGFFSLLSGWMPKTSAYRFVDQV